MNGAGHAAPAVMPALARGRLFRRYFVLILALVTSALVVSSAISLYFSYRETLAALYSLQREKALAASDRIRTYVENIQSQLRGATLPQLGAEGGELRRIEFLKLLKQVPDVTDLGFIGPDGCEKAQVSRLTMDALGECLADRSRDPVFTAPTPSQPWYGPVTFRKETEPYMTIAVRSGGPKGPVTWADVNLKFMWDVISRIKVGESGKAFVVDRTGHLIADPDIGLVLRKSDLSSLAHVATALAGSTDDAPAVVTTDLAGRRVLAAHAPIEPLGWTVFVEQPVAEVTARLNEFVMRTLALIAGGILFSALAALFLARGMARPIGVLQQSAQRIGAGELDHRIELRTGDELEALAGQFNNMTAQLRESYAGLERKVDERTRELTHSLEQQTAISEILRVISSSPTDVKPVLDVVAERAALLCDATYARVLLVEGDELDPVAGYQDGAHASPAMLADTVAVPLDRSSLTGRAAIDLRHDPPRRHRAAARRRVPRRAREHEALRAPRRARRAADARGRRLRRDHPRAHDARVLPARPGRAGRDLRAPVGDRDRQRTAVQRDEGGARPADRDQRDPARDLRLARRRAADARRRGRARAGAMRGRAGDDHARRRRRAALRGVQGRDAAHATGRDDAAHARVGRRPCGARPHVVPDRRPRGRDGRGVPGRARAAAAHRPPHGHGGALDARRPRDRRHPALAHGGRGRSRSRRSRW